MKKQTLVSVVMITYNHEQHIKQAIESVLDQKGQFTIELLVSDDCSPDNTESIVKQIIKEHPAGSAIKYIKHNSNKGVVDNFYWTLSQCSGDFIAFCEGDDYWCYDRKIESQISFLQKNKNLILCGHNVFTLQNNVLHKSGSSYNLKIQFPEILKYNVFTTVSVVFRNDMRSTFPSSLHEYKIGDWPLFVYILTLGGGYIINQSWAVHRNEGKGVWTSLEQEQILKENIVVLNKFKEQYNSYSYIVEKAIDLIEKNPKIYENPFQHLNLTLESESVSFIQKIKTRLVRLFSLPYYLNNRK